MFIQQIYDRKLSQYTYLIGCPDTGNALVIDPERDIDRYIDLAEREGLTITAVAETHIHNDFLSGTRELADRLDVQIYLSDETGAGREYNWAEPESISEDRSHIHLLTDGDAFSVGNIDIRTFHTPGHTPEHLTYLVIDNENGADHPLGMFGGDFLIVDPPLPDDPSTSVDHSQETSDDPGKSMYDSIQRFLYLPACLQIWSGHEGNLTYRKSSDMTTPLSTSGYEQQFHPLINLAKNDHASFIDHVQNQTFQPPMYFSRMKRENRDGPRILHELPQPKQLSTDELVSAQQNQNHTIIDTRMDRSSFMYRHLTDALYAPLNQYFNTVIGSLLVDETSQIILIVDQSDIEEATRDLIRIGYDRIAGFAEPLTLFRTLEQEKMGETIEEIDFQELEQRRTQSGYEVLDVRFDSEYEQEHIAGAINASYTRLPEQLHKIPEDQTMLVHSGTGRRSAVAASYLNRQGYDVQFVNGDFDSYKRA